MSQLLLTAGVNDLGGTLINESISTSAGAQHGQLMRPSEFRQMIREAGRIPAERFTGYEIKRVFDNSDEALDPLDLVGDNVEEIFGSYNRLVKMDNFLDPVIDADTPRLHPLPMQHPRLSDRTERCGSRQPAGHLRRDFGPRVAGPDIAGAYQRRSLGRGNYHRPRVRHPHHLHRHVRPCGN